MFYYPVPKNNVSGILCLEFAECATSHCEPEDRSWFVLCIDASSSVWCKHVIRFPMMHWGGQQGSTLPYTPNNLHPQLHWYSSEVCTEIWVSLNSHRCYRHAFDSCGWNLSTGLLSLAACPRSRSPSLFAGMRDVRSGSCNVTDEKREADSVTRAELQREETKRNEAQLRNRWHALWNRKTKGYDYSRPLNPHNDVTLGLLGV